MNINKNTWPGWPDTRRTNMEYSNAHQHTNGRQLELAWAQHSRPPGDHTSVRWTAFSEKGAPAQGYYWLENDECIWETDNLPSFYMPWKQWVCLWRVKLIDIAAPAGIARWRDAATARSASRSPTLLSMADHFDVVFSSMKGLDSGALNSNYNPACLVNPDGNWTCFFGGGYYTNLIGNSRSMMKLIDDNPNYPLTSTKPLRLRAFGYGTSTTPSPQYARHAIKLGDWVYWGGGYVRDDKSRFREFYRIYIPGLFKEIVSQQRITDAPISTGWPGVRFGLLAGDPLRKRLILVNHEGVFRYQVPADDSPDGLWEGPFKPPGVNWPVTISDGAANGVSGDWHGFIGTHRSDLNQTFFRYNLSRKWNRILW